MCRMLAYVGEDREELEELLRPRGTNQNQTNQGLVDVVLRTIKIPTLNGSFSLKQLRNTPCIIH
ncbi:hypothetical protein [Vulcanisaeta sp. JCM 14467]